jgi:hypothetical protein
MRIPWVLEQQKYLVGSPRGGAITTQLMGIKGHEHDKKYNESHNQTKLAKRGAEGRSRTKILKYKTERIEEAKTKTKPMINEIETERLRNRKGVIVQ